MVEGAEPGVRDAARRLPAAVRDVVRRAHLPGVRRTRGSGPLLGISVLAGAVAGVGASAFYRLFHLLRGWFIEGATGLRVATTVSEPAGAHAMTSPVRPWMVPIVVATGALVSGMVVTRWTGKPGGGGANAAIASVHEDPTGAGLWQTVVQFIGAAITIGTGGSSGSEGPAALIGAGLCSVLARWCRLTDAQARVVVTSGMAACVGAIFRAPLGGALLGPGLLYRRDMATKAVIPSMVASVTAFSIFGAWNGFGSMFGENSGYRFDHPTELIAFVVLGLVAGLLGRTYVATLHATTAATHAREPTRRDFPGIQRRSGTPGKLPPSNSRSSTAFQRGIDSAVIGFSPSCVNRSTRADVESCEVSCGSIVVSIM